MSRVEIGPIATTQLEDIYRYSEARWGRKQADSYVEGALAVMQQLPAQRSNWRAVSPIFGVNGYVRRYRSHFIYWREMKSGSIGIVAVLHERMHQDDRVRQAFSVRE